MGFYTNSLYLLWVITNSILAVARCTEIPPVFSREKNASQNSDNFGYRVELFSRCSAPCDGGVQTAVFVCYDKTTSLKISRSRCQHLPSPGKYERVCNIKPCLYRWRVGTWNACSKSCGQGTTRRRTRCFDKHDKRVSDWKCAQFKVPQRKRKCGVVDCTPEFFVGRWSECSSSCGVGTKKRSVVCKQHLANGTMIILPQSSCTGMPPAKSIRCKVSTGCKPRKHTKRRIDDIQGDAPIDQEEDYDASDSSGEGSGGGEGEGGAGGGGVEKAGMPKIQLSKKKTHTLKKGELHNVVVGSRALAVKGSQITVTCKATGDPPPTITWSRDGYEVTKYFEDDVGIDDNGNLKIRKTDRFNEGVYVCKARNKVGVSSATFTLTVLLANKPNIVSEDNMDSFGPGETNVEVTVGGTVAVYTGTTLKIKCPVLGKPTPAIYWFGNGRPIAVGKAQTIGNNLVIKNIDKIYALKYSCNARNRFGTASAVTLVKVLDLLPPKIATEIKAIDTPQSSRTITITVGTNITVVAGVTLTIRCPIETKPLPFMSWTALGQTINRQLGPVTVANDKSRMVIKQMRIQYTGLYGCSAENAAGKDSQFAYIRVVAPSKPAIQSKQGFRSSLEKDQTLIVTIGEQATGLAGIAVNIICPVTGLPTPTITWQINRKTLLHNDKRYTMEGTMLVIKRLSKSENGQVVCSALNPVGRTTSTSKVNVITGQKPKIASKTGRVSDIQGVEEASITIGQDLRVVQGLIFRLQCPVTGFPTPRVTWSRNDNDVQSSEKVLIDKNNNDLIINGIQKEDTGQYMCTAVNPLGEARQSSYVGIIDEKSVNIEFGNAKVDTSGSLKPVTITIGDALTVLSGTDVTIKCPVKGIPQPYVLWRRNGERIESGDRKGQFRILSSNTALTIFQVDEEVAGPYECIATNVGGADRETSTLTVVASMSPVIDIVSVRQEELKDLSMVKSTIGASIILLAGASLSLRCPAKGVPRPSFTWSLKNKPIKSEGRFSMSGDTLVVNKTQRSDSGRFFCTAKNTVGQEKRYSDVKVLAPIKPRIRGRPRNRQLQKPVLLSIEVGSTIRIVEGGSVHLTCIARGLPKPSIQWKFGEIVVTGEVLKLPKLSPGDSKKYTCEASNLAGVDRRTTSLLVKAIRKPVIMSSKESVTVLGKIKPLTATLGHSVTVIQGSVVTLICHVTGYPQPHLTWAKDTIAIQNLKKKRGFSGKRLNVTHYALKINTKVKTTDFTGKYECIVTNLGGTDIAATNLVVKVPTKAAIKPAYISDSLGLVKQMSSRDPVTINVGDNAQLLTKTELTILCPITGLPTPRVIWYAGRRRVRSGGKYTLGRGTDLMIGSKKFPTSTYDSLRYACTASNFKGRDIVYSTVRFTAPKAPRILSVSGHFNFPINTTVNLIIGSSVTAITGSFVTLVCDASGLPNPLLTWTKDDVIIRSNGSRLTISDTQKSDSGIYECAASNLAGTRTVRSVVKIEDIKVKTEKPKIFRSNQNLIASENKLSFTFVIGDNITILEGKDLVLQCPTYGLPKPQVTWLFNNTPIVESDTLVVDPDTGAIKIIEMTREETGKYQCLSKNIAGEDIAITYAIVVGPKKPKIKRTQNVYFRLNPGKQPIKINIGDTLTTFIGTRVTINCPSTGFPDPRIRWNQNDISLTPQISIFLNGFMLILTNPEVSDTGKYTCLASNPGGSVNASSNVTFLAPQAPNITTQPENVEYLERGTVTLRIGSNLKVLAGSAVRILCDVTGIPKPVLSWRKDGRNLRFSGKVLTVTSIRRWDSGRITCNARNHFGKDTATTQITVIVGRSPYISYSRKPITSLASISRISSDVGAPIKLLQRSNVTIFCRASGIPKPVYAWSHKNTLIINNERISFNKSTGVLRMKNITVQDSGQLKCTATNVIGISQRGSSLQVIAIKNPGIGTSSRSINSTTVKKISAQIGDSIATLVNTTITIECPVISGFPAPVTSWTHNGKPVKRKRVRIRGSKLTITKAKMNDEGVYTCTARNPGGSVTAKSSILLDPGEEPSIATSDDVISDRTGIPQITATIGSPVSLLSGTGIKLVCLAKGLPLPTVSWQVGGRPLTSSPGVVIDKVNNAVTITNLQKRDSNRIFTCTARNTLGATRASSRLTVIEPIAPKITTSKETFVQLDSQNPVSLPIGSKIRVLAGTTVSLRCKSRGLPKPEVAWTLANIPVTSGGQVTFDNDTLKFINMGNEDGGSYTCKATSPFGMDTASSTINVEELTGPFIAKSYKVFNTIESIKPIEIKIGANLTALSTTNITIDCTATGVPVPGTSWIKDGAIINKDHVTVRGSKLKITGSRFADGGVYACIATSLARDVIVVSHITVIAGQKPIISSSDEVESSLKGFTNLTTTIGSSVSILSGSGIRLLCPVKGVPKPMVSWRIDSKSQISRNRVAIDRIQHSLSIPRLVSSDYGNYICIAKNILGETSSSSALNVIEPFSPKIDSSKQSIVVLKVQVPAKIRVGAKVRVLSGVTLTLVCKAVGLPLPNITWTLDGKPLESKGHVTVEGESLVIVNSGADDSGSYICTASSAMGEDTAATTLLVQSGKKARITTAGRKISLLTGLVSSTSYIGDNITILQSSELSLLCPTEGIPEPKVSWLVKGRPLVTSKRVILNPKTKTLTIKDLKIEDSGMFTCEAKNVRGEDRKSSVLNILVPFGPTMKKSSKAIDGLKSTKPIEVQIGSSVTALINASIIINCEVSGLPIPKVFWTKDGESITSKGHVTVKIDSVKIEKALLSDQGVYQCTAHSDVGSVSGISKITVKEPIPPSIKASNKSIDSLTRKPVGIVIGETVRTLTRIDFNITCAVEGLPQPEIVWKKNGVELPADGRTFINGPIIYVTGSLTTDTGYYICEAKNVAGKKAVVSKLNIREPIIPEITTIDERKLYDLRPVTITTEVGTFIKTLETSNITLTCSASGFPSPIISWKKGVTTLVAHGNMTYTISNAKVSDSGIYTCTASNIKGFDFRTSNLTIVAPIVPVIQTASKDLSVMRLESVNNDVGKPIITLSGNAIQLTCNATGVPSPSLQWYKGKVKLDNTGSSLSIKSSKPGDSAIYTCTAKNLAGMTKANTNLTILEGIPPTIITANKTISQITQIGYIVVKVGGVINTLLSSNVEITCEVSGFPQPNVAWYKGDFEVDKDPNTLVNKKGTLMFVSLALRKAGIYKCVATNPLGSSSASTVLNVKGLKHPYINNSRGVIKNLKSRQPQRIHIGQDLTVLSNTNVSITCPLGGIPIPEVGWKRGETELESGGRFMIGQFELNISNVVKDDSAFYVCIVKNMMGQISHGSNLKVLDPKKPVIHAKYQEIKITQRQPVQANIGSKVTTIPGNKLTLTCNVSGLPEPNILWKRNELIAQDGGSTYVIKKLRTSDTGVYTCIASNLVGHVTATSHVIILVGSMPEIVTTKTNVIATKGENEVTVDIGGNVTTIVGTGVEISCNAKGVPHPSITWVQNGSRIVFTSVRLMNKRTKGFVLLGVTLDDVGFYTCFANNAFGQVSATTHITVFAAKRPAIRFSKRQIKDYDRVTFDVTIGDSLATLIGSTVTIKCSATGNPPPEITWTKSGSPIRKTVRIKVVNSTLRIFAATWSDTGQYECTATNAGGSDRKTSFLKFIPPEKPVIHQNDSVIESYDRKPVVMVIGNTLKILTQTPITINCTAFGIPTPSYSWTKKGSVIKSSHNLEISRGGKQLTLRNVTLDDAGIYGCTASNKAGKQEAIAPILLLEPLLPKIVSTDENITWYDRVPLAARVGGKIIALTGTQVTLTCQAHGFPEPTMSWRRDDDPNELETDGQYRLANRSLVIFAVQPSDSGRYICIAGNLAGNVQSETNLRVIDPEEPVITISNKVIRTQDRLPVMATIGNRVIVLAGTLVSIKCPVKGIPKPSVSWSTGGQFILLTNANSTLELNNTSVSSSGEYTCTAISPIGGDVASSVLLVADPIKPSIQIAGVGKVIDLSNKTRVSVTIPDSITVFTGTTVNIKCPAIGLPKPKISWKKDGKTLKSSLNTLTVKPGSKADGGVFTCVAENSEGIVRRSSSVDVVEPSRPRIKYRLGLIDALDKPQTTNATIGMKIKTLTMTSVILKCPATGSPSPTITWSKSGDLIVSGKRITVTDDGDLVIQKSRTADSGNYICIARSVVGKDTAVSTIIVFNPTRPEILRSTDYVIWYENLPFKSKIGNNLTTMKGRKLTLICPARGMPRPEFAWYRGGEKMRNEDNYVIRGDTLIIWNLSVFDTDRYTCVAANYVGADAATSTLKVHDPVVPYIYSSSGFIDALAGYNPVNVTVGQDVIAPISSQVKLICPYKGVPRPKILWIKDHETVISDDTIEVDCNGTLKFHGIRAKDAGEFVCYVESFLGMDMALSHVKLVERSTPIIEKSNNVIPLGDKSKVTATIGDNVTALQTHTIEIKCNAKGIPYPVITWTRNGLEINSVGMYSIDKKGTLTITGAGRDGVYVCTALNDQGMDSATTQIAIKEPKRPEIVSPRDPRNIPFTHHKNVTINVRDNLTALPSSNITIRCHAIGVPDPIVTWSKDGNETRPGIEVLSNGYLLIRDASEADIGLYTCKAENIRGSTTASSYITIMKPTKPAIDRPIEPRNIPATDADHVTLSVGENVTSLVGTRLLIDCDVDGDPKPFVTWTKDNIAIKGQDGFVVFDNGTLAITTASVDDAGKYVCTSRNDGGKDEEEANVKIIVPQKPKISTSVKPSTTTKKDRSPVAMTIGDNVTALTNTTISIDCTVSGIPEPTITWMKDDQVFSVASGHVIHSNGTLVIEKANLDDKGKYTCTTKNVEGEDKATSFVNSIDSKKPKITVKDKPRHIHSTDILPVTITIGDNLTVLADTKVYIQCSATGLPGPRITWYKDGKVVGGTVLIVLWNRTHNIQRLSAEGRGRYTCAAKNIDGQDAKTSTVITVDPEEPRVTRPTKPLIITTEDGNPVIIDVGKNINAIIETKISINCRVTGVPKPTIQWKKNGFNIVLNERLMMLPDGTLVIDKALVNDKGRYTCVVTSIAGDDSLSTLVDIMIPVKPKIKTRDTPRTVIPVNKAPLDIVIGDKVTALTDTSVSIHCEAVAIPKAQIMWSKGNKLLRPGNRYTMFSNGTLLIKKVAIASRGRYSCTARNKLGADSKTSMVEAVDPQKPQVIKPFSPSTITKQDRSVVDMTVTDTVKAFTRTVIIITCTSTGIPAPMMSWSSRGTLLTTGDRYAIHNNGTLVIRNTTKEDEGRYTCIAKNTEGEDRESTDVAITVPIKPVIIRATPKTIPIGDGGPKELDVGSNVTTITYEFVQINCQARGVPAPDVMWYKRDRVVNARLDRAKLLGNGRLGLYAITLAQAGTYTCKATNIEGEDRVDSVLTVIRRKRPKITRPQVPQDFIVQVEPSKKIAITDNITTKPGKTISITCMSRGTPEPKVTWAKDDDVIKPGGDISIDVNGTLTLRNVKEDQSGKYTCTVKSRIGSDRAASQVLIIPLAKPSIEKSPVSGISKWNDVKPFVMNIGDALNGFPGTPITIKCRAGGVPQPRTAWFKDGLPVNPGYIVNQEGSLVIGKAVKEDSGRYTCQATNLVGKDSADTMINVLTPVKPSIAKTQVDLIELLEVDQDITANIGTEITTLIENTIVMNCKATGFPKPEITWAKDLQPVKTGDFQIVKNNSLVIQSAQVDDTAIYTCTARNYFGSDEAHSKVEIIETEIPVIQRTDGSVEMEDFNEIKVNVGKHVSSLSRINITVNCPVRGVPRPSIEWMNGGKMLNVRGSKLTLNNVDRSISGKYTCVASNVAGKVSAYSMINITEPVIPVIHRTSAELVLKKVTSISSNIGGSIEILIGSNLLLLCNATGHPTPQVKWFKSGVAVSSGNRYVVNGRSLRIFGVQQSDSSEYSCTATNVVGQVTASSELTVKGFLRPTIKVVKQQIKNFDKTRPISVTVGTILVTSPQATVIISCPVSALPTAQLSWQRAGEPIVPSGKYRMNQDKSKLTISDVGFKDAGAYVCTAFNRAGTDFAAMDLIVATPPVITNVRGSFDVTDIRELISITTGAVVTIPRGVSIRIKCDTKGTPTPNITWFKVSEGSIVRQPIGFKKHHTFIDKDGFLSIEQTKEFDVAQYICVATNIAGRDEGVTHLNVGAAPDLPGHWSAATKFTRPRIERIESMATVVRGSAVRLRCAVYGSPKPNVTWIVVGNERKDHWVVYADGSLEIPKVDFSDEGNYTCIASNVYGRTYRSTNITVLVPPQILDTFFSDWFIKKKAQLLHIKYSSITRLSIKRDQTRAAAVEMGGNLIVGCPVKGRPEPSILWLRDGLKVRNDSKHLILGGVLLIRRVSKEDAGEYFCFVKNTAGEDGGGIDLHVRDKIVGYWLPTPWSECENCYLNFRGYKTRSISCADDKNNTVPESFCSRLPRPIIRQKCRARSCEAIWVSKPWSPCSALCGGKGVRTRTVGCLFYKSLLPAKGLCTGDRPDESQPCNRAPCGQRICKDFVAYCRQIMQQGLCKTFQPWCCQTCNGEPGSASPAPN